jgi:hypothetical protein
MRLTYKGIDLTFENVEIERFDGGIDWRRVIYEVAKDAFPRTSVKYQRLDDVVVAIDADLGEVARVPIWRVACFDDDRLYQFICAAVGGLEDPDEVIADLEVYPADVIDDVDSDWVLVHVNGFRLAAVHRGLLVEGWPHDDDGNFCA